MGDPRRAMRLLFAVVAVAGSAASARAEPGDGETKALAEMLFRDGRRAMANGELGPACAKLGESQRLDPKLGTLLNLATCHELEGRLASAWAEFTEGRRQAQRARRIAEEAFARSHASALERKLAHVVLAMDGAVAGTELVLDGNVLGAALLGSPLPVDRGHHEVIARAPGRVSQTIGFDVTADATTASVTIPQLVSIALPETAAPVRAPSADVPRIDHRPQRYAGAPLTVVGAAGALAVAGFGIGTWFGLRALAKNRDADRACREGCTASAPGFDAEAHRAATVSTIALGIAVAATATGVAVLLTRRPARTAAARGKNGVWIELETAGFRF